MHTADSISPIDQETHRRIERKLQEACAALLRAGINIAVIGHTLNNYVIELWSERIGSMEEEKIIQN